MSGDFSTESRDLLIRIDERTNNLVTSVSELKSLLSTKVENDQEYKTLISQVRSMWDLKNKAIGYIAAWSAFVSIAVVIIVEYVRGLVGGK